MNTKQLFAGLTPAQEKAYATEAAKRWDEKSVRASQKKYQAYSAAEKARIAAEGEAVYRDLITEMPEGPTAPAVQSCIARWRRHIGYFWTPNDPQCLGLAKLYRDDPAFRKTYDAMHPDLAAFMVEAVKHHVAVNKKQDGGAARARRR